MRLSLLYWLEETARRNAGTRRLWESGSGLRLHGHRQQRARDDSAQPRGQGQGQNAYITILIDLLLYLKSSSRSWSSGAKHTKAIGLYTPALLLPSLILAQFTIFNISCLTIFNISLFHVYKDIHTDLLEPVFITAGFYYMFYSSLFLVWC